MKATPEHKQTRTELNTVDIDDNIRDIVIWMNLINGIHTHHSCEDNIGRPYVVFTSSCGAALSFLCRAIGELGKITVEYHSDTMPLRYILEFNNKNARDRFSVKAREQTKEPKKSYYNWAINPGEDD